MDEMMEKLIENLAARLGRLPTEDEVITFIQGSEEERTKLWNP